MPKQEWIHKIFRNRHIYHFIWVLSMNSKGIMLRLLSFIEGFWDSLRACRIRLEWLLGPIGLLLTFFTITIFPRVFSFIMRILNFLTIRIALLASIILEFVIVRLNNMMKPFNISKRHFNGQLKMVKPNRNV